MAGVNTVRHGVRDRDGDLIRDDVDKDVRATLGTVLMGVGERFLRNTVGDQGERACDLIQITFDTCVHVQSGRSELSHQLIKAVESRLWSRPPATVAVGA